MQVLHDPQSATMVQDFRVIISNPQLVQDRLQKLGFDTGRNPLDRLREGTLIKALHTLQGMDEILRNPLGRHEHEFNYGLRQHEKILNALVGHNDDWSELSYVEYKKRFQKEVTRITSLRSMSNANQVLQDAHELKDKAEWSLRLKDINLGESLTHRFIRLC